MALAQEPGQFGETNDLKKLQVKIGGMSCSFCTESIRTAYGRMPGVHQVNVSLAHEEALIQYDPKLVKEGALVQTLRDLGYTVRDPRKVRSFEEQEAELRHSRRLLNIAIGLTLVTLALMGIMWLGFKQPWHRWAFAALAVATVFGPGGHIVRMAVASLRRGILNQHVLLEFGAFGGLLGGLLGFYHKAFPLPAFFAVAVFITTYHLLSGYVSQLVRTRSSQAVRKLMDLQPAVARVVRDGEELEVPIEAVRVDDVVRIRPGEQVPVDGVVVEGHSTCNEAFVTGEPIPASKREGSSVVGGSINQTGTLLVRVTRVGEDSFLQQVIRHVEEARALKPGIIQLVDVVLRFYVPAILVIAAVALAGWSLVGDPIRGLFAALAVLVMGYPCALGMATPLAMIRGGGMAAQKGVLMRSGEAFQALKDIDTVVLDKTGTITKGRPEVAAVVPAAKGLNRELLLYAGSVEAVSEHPLAQAIVRHALEAGLDLVDVQDFTAVPGRGVRARLEEETVVVGSPRFLQEEGVALEDQDRLAALESHGHTVVGVARGGRFLGWLAIADQIKPEAAETVRRIKQSGLTPVMITGDNQRTATAVAETIGIKHFYAETLPGQKADRVRALQQQGHRVVMVGDGINDAPALVQADIGVAIGAGTDIAIDSSEVVLVNNNLHGVMDAYEIGKNSYRKTVQNLSLAFAFNGVGVPLAALGWLQPTWAMLAMILSVSTVLINSFAGKLLKGAAA